jgi:hypothetical protein
VHPNAPAILQPLDRIDGEKIMFDKNPIVCRLTQVAIIAVLFGASFVWKF